MIDDSGVCTGHDAVQKVTLIPRGQARGLTWFIPGEDPTLISKQQIFARIVGALGGRAAEQVIFGDAEVTTGASSDLQQVGNVCLYAKGYPFGCTFYRRFVLLIVRGEAHAAMILQQSAKYWRVDTMYCSKALLQLAKIK